MDDKQRTWIEEQDEAISRGEPDLRTEAMHWCGHRQIKWDRDKLKRLAPLLLEYGKPQELIDMMRIIYVEWVKAPMPTPEEMQQSTNVVQ